VATFFPDSVEQEAMANPLATIFTQVRYAVIDPTAPTAADVIGGETRLLIPLAVVMATFVLGFWVFAREAPRIAEDL
jgi:ABC-2 type transport system permease protein